MRASSPTIEEIQFPDPEQADSNGLLAAGGELTPEWLLSAYSQGIFPWYDTEDGPILWWSPEPRAIIFFDNLRISKSLAKRIRSGRYRVTVDQAFAQVIEACAAPRHQQSGTWITTAMQSAYIRLHQLGYAHSVEVWQQQRLIGGLYGISLGRLFFGESMFSKANDASKVALVALATQLKQWGFDFIDCQLMNDHLISLGARPMPRRSFLKRLVRNRSAPTRQGPWTWDPDLDLRDPSLLNLPVPARQ